MSRSSRSGGAARGDPFQPTSSNMSATARRDDHRTALRRGKFEHSSATRCEGDCDTDSRPRCPSSPKRPGFDRYCAKIGELFAKPRPARRRVVVVVIYLGPPAAAGPFSLVHAAPRRTAGGGMLASGARSRRYELRRSALLPTSPESRRLAGSSRKSRFPPRSSKSRRGRADPVGVLLSGAPVLGRRAARAVPARRASPSSMSAPIRQLIVGAAASSSAICSPRRRSGAVDHLQSRDQRIAATRRGPSGATTSASKR